MSIYDAFHFTDARRQELINSYPKHVRKARIKGLPAIGEGSIFPIDDEFIQCPRFEIPRHWLEIGGLDFGWDHPTAAIRLVIDVDTQTFYVTDTYKVRQKTPMHHVDKLKGWGKSLPFAWGLEGHQTKLSDDPEKQYKTFEKHGLKMLNTHATFDDGGVGVEQGVQEILELMESGRFFVFQHLSDWFEEKSGYHRAKSRDDAVAKIKGVFDDLIDATRYAMMMRRYAVPIRWRTVHGGPPTRKRGKPRDTRNIFS